MLQMAAGGAGGMGAPRGGPAGGFNRRDIVPPNFGGRGAGPPGGMGMAPPGMMMGRGTCGPFPCCVFDFVAEHQSVLIVSPVMGIKPVGWRLGTCTCVVNEWRQRLMMRNATASAAWQGRRAPEGWRTDQLSGLLSNATGGPPDDRRRGSQMLPEEPGGGRWGHAPMPGGGQAGGFGELSDLVMQGCSLLTSELPGAGPALAALQFTALAVAMHDSLAVRVLCHLSISDLHAQ